MGMQNQRAKGVMGCHGVFQGIVACPYLSWGGYRHSSSRCSHENILRDKGTPRGRWKHPAGRRPRSLGSLALPGVGARDPQ